MASKQRSQPAEELEQHLVTALTDADVETLIKTPRRLATESNLDGADLALAIRELAYADGGPLQFERWSASNDGSTWQISLADGAEGGR